ncbi:MAG: heavy-metal-associated domain-containing protein [Candidatus Neomarinimicrobiota bacterium]|jgi:copper chaperone CopZ|nr:heavy-metal-associated domain-containing protein [Candidatus Neomarinimicrobiota bacterium]
MKQILITLTILSLIACSGDTTKADIALNTIQCGMCKNTIESGVAEVDGVVKVEVDTEKKVGHVIYKAGVVNLAVIEGAIAALGYDANETKADPDAYAELPGCCQKGGMH